MTDRRTTFVVNEEGEHELRAALLGIEVSAERLSRHRGRLTDRQVEELTCALAHDVRRLRPLLGGRTAAARTFDLAEVLEPVVTSARASGLDVRCSVRRGIAVVGDGYRAAQVLLSLLDDARRHAPASSIEVRAREFCGKVALYVEDRERTVSDALRDRLLECGGASGGTELGLYVARRVMEEQKGALAVRARPGGGATFVLHFPLDSACTYRTHRGQHLPCGRAQ